MKFKLLTLIIIFAALVSCGGNKTREEEGTASVSAAPDTVFAVVNVPSQKATSQKVLVSKGVIKADNEVAVYSRITGQLNEVRLIDGTKVSKGQVLFTLDDQELKADVELCEAELEQARMRMEDILLGQGYKRTEFDKIPESILSLARIKSGCNVKEKELEIARKRLSNAVIKAPLSGVLSNLAPTSFAYVNPGETLCKIVDTKFLIVEFSILETELRRFQLGSVIQISSIAYSEVLHNAVVRSIGSVVDEAGMIKVEAELQDTENLMPGMTAIVRL